MTLIEQLLQLDATLRALIPSANRQALDTAVQEVEAFRPAYVSPDVPPRVLLAAQLLTVESGCKLVRDLLGVELTVATKVTVSLRGTPSEQPTAQ